MSGGNQSEITVVLRNPLNHDDKINYFIKVYDNPLAKDWIISLKQLLSSKNLLEKNFCFMGFPKTARDLDYLCKELNQAIYQINTFNSLLVWVKNNLDSYFIEEYFVPDSVRYGREYPVPSRFHPEGNPDWHRIQCIGLVEKKEILNKLHNHFEVLQGTVNSPSPYYILADHETKYAIRQLNILCHEIETLILSQQKEVYLPEWIRPSQITTWLHAPRYELQKEHRKLFLENGYDRRFGHVYMHWAQIGKTLFEVFRDEDAPELTDAICEAITHLQYYSGEFDIEWGLDVVSGEGSRHFWHVEQQKLFKEWLIKNNLDPANEMLSLGYLPIGEVDLQKSFGTTDHFQIWDILSTHLDIYSVTVEDVTGTYDYCWTDSDYKQMQIDMMKPGYDYSSGRGR
jgi:hypothetical protein